MANMPHATSTPKNQPLVTVIHVPASLSSRDPSIDIGMISQERREFISSIRGHIANNESVLIKKWYPEERIGFNVEDMGMILPFMQQEVDYQGIISTPIIEHILNYNKIQTRRSVLPTITDPTPNPFTRLPLSQNLYLTQITHRFAEISWTSRTSEHSVRLG